MKIRILAVGKLKQGPLAELISQYLKRCQWQIKITEIDHSPRENEILLTKISDDDHVILLDENGKNISSQQLSETFETLQNSSRSKIVFIIGGATGVGEYIKKRADMTLAFGSQTWPHMLVRVMLVEQIYRAEQILKGHPYHKV